jgi:two-component system response regulator HydG
MDTRKVLCVGFGMSFAAEVEQLRAHGWNALPASNPEAARRILAHQPVQTGLLMLRDFPPARLGELEPYLNLSRQMEWVSVFNADALDSPALRELVLSNFFDFHTHPLNWQELNLTLVHALRRAKLHEPEDKRLSSSDQMGMVGQSAAIEQLRRQVRKVASTDVPVLIGGESGSGKELAAQAVHHLSPRASGPFVPLNCGAIAPSLIQSELFGHERGAFTGATTIKHGLIEEASGGTLFLDEIADLPLELQANLLRFLQEHTIQRVGSNRNLKVDVRVVAASHADLVKAVTAGRFREDLFYRLNVLPIVVPALRERMADIIPLAHHFLHKSLAQAHGQKVAGFSQQAMAAMLSHGWPGNVRELRNRVQRAVVMTEQRLIASGDLGLGERAPEAAVGLEAARTMAERDVIALTLERLDHNVTHAARELGISRMTLYRLMDKHGLAARGERPAH